ncbi:EF-1 guanine nucleotide exchange domain-containing protein [Ditylenchus destructor]|uniref:EF-1 guanine nucleotide exchange domain-containing protein n=1 Tax=Ditylenchus destructor TaxID=166010 RepID=A0AAD4R6D3_9BILA|nr:EF-1 guanine nucleotide exchange domain-containing protein [Ditylenchus destructor]
MSDLAFSQGKVSTNDGKQLDEFNTYLASRAYVNGFAPSKEDEVAHKSFGSAPAQKYPHIARWYKHIASFDDKERSSWPKQSQGGEAAATPAAGGGDDFDLFGSESEDDEEKERVKQERLKAYAEKKSKKPGPIAKSNIIYDVKPWDDTIDLKEIEKHVRSIATDGLVWGASKILPIAYGLNKLQICCVIEDEKVSSDWLEEQITDNEDLVQSVDVVAFNKV